MSVEPALHHQMTGVADRGGCGHGGEMCRLVVMCVEV